MQRHFHFQRVAGVERCPIHKRAGHMYPDVVVRNVELVLREVRHQVLISITVVVADAEALRYRRSLSQSHC